MDKMMLEAICKAKATGERAALITIVKTWGSTPRKAGSKMLIWPDGRSLGSIGGGCAEADIKRQALMALDSNQPFLHRIEMLNDVATSEGMVCGGVIDVFIGLI